jgi:hypothetical protein
MHLPADSSIVLLRGTGFRCFSPHMSLSHHSAAYLGTRLHGRTPACTNSCKPLPSPALPYYQLPYQLTSLPPFPILKHRLETCSAFRDVFGCLPMRDGQFAHGSVHNDQWRRERSILPHLNSGRV